MRAMALSVACPHMCCNSPGKTHEAKAYTPNKNAVSANASRPLGAAPCNSIHRPMNTSWSKPVREAVAAMPMANKANIQRLCAMDRPSARQINTAKRPMASKLANWFLWRKLPMASPR